MKKYILEYKTHDEVLALLGREIPHEHLEYVSTIILDLYEEEYEAIKNAGYNIVENNYDIIPLYAPPTFPHHGGGVTPPYFNAYMKVPEAHAAGFDGKGVTIALLGTGCNVNSAATVPTLIQQDYTGLGIGESTVHESRGTMCISQMLYFANPAVSAPYGIAKGCQLYNMRCWEGGTAAFIAAVNWSIANNIDIINISFDLFGDMTTAIQAAIAAGIIVVCASGNSLYTNVAHPANIAGVIAVNAVETTTAVLFGSYITTDSHKQVTVTTYNGGHFQTFAGGTSQAAWMVSGILAIYKQKYPSLTTEKAIRLLHSKALKLNGYTYDESCATRNVMLNYETGAGFLAPIN